MTNYTQRGSRLFVGKDEDTTNYHTMPGNTYTVHHDDMMGFYLERIVDFVLPEKVYGDVEKHAGRILTTFHKRKGSTGVHLNGVKGSGKTLLVKAISYYARVSTNIPTIVINHPFHGDSFNAFIQSISSDAIIVFDEFEKTYGWQDQKKVLTLLDGVYESRKLFLLTTNDSGECSEYLKNRPGRMFYSLTYDVLDAATILEVLTDMLVDQTQVQSIVKYAQVFTFLNFDMLVAIIEEMNRYDETLEDVLKMLNVQPEMRREDKFKIALVVGGQAPYHLETTSGYDPNTWSEYIEGSKIIQAGLPADQRGDMDEDDGDDGDGGNQLSPRPSPMPVVGERISADEHCRIGPQDLSAFDASAGVFTYELNWRGTLITVTATRETEERSRGSVFNIKAL